VWRFSLVDSVHPPSPLPRWAATLNFDFVIPTGAKRKGGTCSFTFPHSECAMSESPPGSVSPSTETAGPSPALRSSRDDKWRVSAFLGSSGSGWTESRDDKVEVNGPVSAQQLGLGAPFKPYFGLSGIPQPSMARKQAPPAMPANIPRTTLLLIDAAGTRREFCVPI